MKQNPYASIEYKIKLPQKHKIGQQKRLFQLLPNAKDANGFQISEPLLNKTNDLIHELNHSFQIYENPKEFQFTFPESLFPNVTAGERNNISYEQKMIVEEQNIFKNKLSQEQLAEIAEKGEFKVKSNIEYITLPYVWKINEVIFWGRQKVQTVWNNSLAKIFGLFYDANIFLQQVIPQQTARIKSIPKRLFTLIFGGKTISLAVGVDYQKQIFKDFWKKIMDNYYKESDEWGSALWNYIYVYFDPEMNMPAEVRKRDEEFNKRKRQEKQELQKKYREQVGESQNKRNKIMKAHYSFNQQWAKLKKVVINEISSEVTNLNNSTEQRPDSQEEMLSNNALNTNNDDKIIQKLADKKFTLYIDHLRNELPKEEIPLDVINCLVFLLRLFRVINLKSQRKDKVREKKRIQVQGNIRKNHPIKSIYKPFFQKQMNDKMAVIDKDLDESMYQQLKNDVEFTSLLKNNQIDAYREFVRLRSNYQTEQIVKRRQIRQLHQPSRIFYSNYHLLPPYQVLKVESDYDFSSYYSLKTISDDLTVDTASNFWKLKLYCMRVKTWTINCLIFLVFVVWKGPTGLRCLFGIRDFQYDMGINYQTGEILSLTRKTVIGTFKTVLAGIEKSRKKFEDTPDLGLLGKNFSRFFNYIQCYVFRLLFVGVIITLILYPCLIVVSSAITTILVVTFWAWIPVILLITYLFNVLIYQFESGRIPDRLMVRSIPLLLVILGILRAIFTILLAILMLTIFAPIASIFILLVSSIQRGFRQLLDGIMIFMFRHLGRSPSRNTAIAKKISGPGMTKEFYMSINQQDVYVLIQAELEKLYLKQFNRVIQSKILQNKNLSQWSLSKILGAFGSYYSHSNFLLQNTDNLLANYYTQYNYYVARYPNRPNRVRFTQQQIDSYFDNTVSIVRNFVNKNQINKWIFEDHQLYEDMYDELTRSVWMKVFNCGEEIFQPLQKLDARFKLEDQYSHDYDSGTNESFNSKRQKSVGKVMRALEGQVELSHANQKLTPFKHNLLNRESSIGQIDGIFSLWSKNSIQHVNLNLSDLRTLFVPNLNIDEIIKTGNDQRALNITGHPNIIDL